MMDKPRRLFTLLLILVLVLTACTPRTTTQTPAPTATPSPTPTPVESAEVVETPEVSEEPGFVADPDASVAFVNGPISGSEFDTRLWASIRSFCDANGKECWSYDGYSILSSDGDAPLNALKAPVEDGHKIVVASGPKYLGPANDLAGEDPDTVFLVLDRYHPTLDGYTPAGGVAMVGFDQVQIGYLAGYAAVGDGYTKLGFLGFSDTSYGYGFVQGANDAAQAAGITVEMLYCYTDPEMPREQFQAMADLWYRSGIQLIFNSQSIDWGVIAAAEENERKVITITGPLSSQSAAVLATVGPDAEQTVSRFLTAYYSGRFPGGENQTLGCAEQAVSLDISRMAKFGQYDYEYVYGKLAAGTVTPLGPADAESPDKLPCPNVKVNLIEGGQSDG